MKRELDTVSRPVTKRYVCIEDLCIGGLNLNKDALILCDPRNLYIQCLVDNGLLRETVYDADSGTIKVIEPTDDKLAPMECGAAWISC